MELPIFLDENDGMALKPAELFNILSSGENEYLQSFDLQIKTDKFMASGIFFIPRDVSLEGKVKIYINKMLIENKNITLPNFLKYISGIIITGEIYDESLLTEQITSYVLNYLKDLQVNKNDIFTDFYLRYYSYIKEAIIDSTNENKDYKDKLIDLLQYNTNFNESITLSLYINSLDEDQNKILYLAGERIEEMFESPYLERLNDNKICVLLLTDMIDEYLFKKIKSYKDHEFLDITREDIEIILDDEQSAQDFIEVEKFYEGVNKDLKNLLGNAIEEVRLSRRLVNSPSLLLTKKNGVSPNMERVIRSKHSFDECINTIDKRILEINPNHILIHALYEIHDESIDAFNNMGKILYQTTLIRCGIPLYRPIGFTNSIYGLMAFCLNIDEEYEKDPDEIELQLSSSSFNSNSGGGVGGDESSS